MSFSFTIVCIIIIKKTSADSVFLVCAGAVAMSTVFLILSIVSRLSTVNHHEMVALLGAQVAAIVIVIACQVSTTYFNL